MKSMRKRRPISLIEVMISLSLVSLLLSTLFVWYRMIINQKESFNQLKRPLIEERYAYQRLQRIVPTADLPFFTSSLDGSPIFIFDRGPFLDPRLSGKVLGHLYFDSIHHCLCLGVWPYPNSDKSVTYAPSQTLVLLDKVSQCTFEYYSPPDLFKKPVDPSMVGKRRPSAGWQDRWYYDYDTTPALIKLKILRSSFRGVQEHPIEYFFDLPIDIFYPKETA